MSCILFLISAALSQSIMFTHLVQFLFLKVSKTRETFVKNIIEDKFKLRQIIKVVT